MSPEDAIASLNRQLSQHGEDIILTRVVGTSNQAKSSAKVRAFVRGYAPHELVGGIIQGDSHVTISPTDLARTQWPGGTVSNQSDLSDHQVPLKNDRCVVAGRTRTVQAAQPFYLSGVLVRIEMQVRG